MFFSHAVKACDGEPLDRVPRAKTAHRADFRSPPDLCWKGRFRGLRAATKGCCPLETRNLLKKVGENFYFCT